MQWFFFAFGLGCGGRGGGRRFGGRFLSFSLILNVFPSGSQWVLIALKICSTCSQYFPQDVPNGFSSHSQFIPHVLNIFPKMFPMGSHRIPNLFHMFSIFSPRCSQWVLIAFPICSACSQNFPQDVPNGFSSHSQFVLHVLKIFPKMFPIAPLFYLIICFDKCYPPLTIVAIFVQLLDFYHVFFVKLFTLTNFL
jgi:hypothetical protein